MNNSLMAKLLANSTIKSVAVLDKSEFFNEQDKVDTGIPIFNLAFSGSLSQGFNSGINVIAGESKSGKSLLGLMGVRAYLNKYPKAVCLFYDNEFGTVPPYFRAIGIDTSRVLHCPMIHIEQLKFDLVKQLEGIERGDKVVIFVDSLGQLASKKELEDAEAQKSVADFTKAKALRSLFRMVTSTIVMKDISMFVIAHTYETMELYPSKVVSGGQGAVYAANSIFILTKTADKNADHELLGFDFNITVEKSRFVREKSKLSLEIDFEYGISRFSGLLKLALKTGHVVSPVKGSYSRVLFDPKTNVPAQEQTKWKSKQTYTEEFWAPLLKNQGFEAAVESLYKLGLTNIFQDSPQLLQEKA